MRDGILWEPDWEEIRWERALARPRLFEQQLRERELLEQRQWLTAATQRMAEVALELDAAERRIKLQEEIEKNDKWWADLNARREGSERETNGALPRPTRWRCSCGDGCACEQSERGYGP
jgi:hypothetical protein